MTQITPSTGLRRRPAVTASAGAASLVGRVTAWAAHRPHATAVTHLDYDADPTGVPHRLSWAQLHRRAAALAIRIGQTANPGDRVAVLAPTGVDYVVALLGAWYAHTVAVPLFTPELSGHSERLAGSFDDCAPTCVLTTTAAAEGVTAFVRTQGGGQTVLRVDDRSDDTDEVLAAGWRAPVVAGSEVAYLQYTSGSTRVPAGVEITYDNLTANVEQLVTAFIAGHPGSTAVSWLPLFHDMGLLTAVAVPLFTGCESVIFDPIAFLLQPVRWLRLLSQRSAFTAAPNFAYDYCLRRIRPEDLAGLDLSGVFTWLNAAEPVRPETMAAFPRALAGTGIVAEAMCAAYGLAEATVYVAGGATGRLADRTRFARTALTAGEGRPPRGDEATTTLVSCGVPGGQSVVAVDPTGRALPPGRVGEIWVHGPNVAHRYWRQPERSVEVFEATLTNPPPGLPTGPWLRTGDLGLLQDGALYITGRSKDLLIVGGRNHYPQDVEATFAEAVGGSGTGRIAVFSVLVEGAERAVAVCEYSRSAGIVGDPAEIARAARVAVWAEHRLALHDVLVTTGGSLARTSSGKVSRSGCRERYLAGAFTPVSTPQKATIQTAGAQPTITQPVVPQTMRTEAAA